MKAGEANTTSVVVESIEVLEVVKRVISNTTQGFPAQGTRELMDPKHLSKSYPTELGSGNYDWCDLTNGMATLNPRRV
jgi:hypothetical protein